MVVDSKNVVAKDPNDYNYVSIKNFLRKQKIERDGDSINNIIGRPGPITGYVYIIIDTVTTLIIKVFINIVNISKIAFDWVYNMMFGAFNGIIPTSASGGTVISMKYFRYLVTVLMPPFGILVTKGLYGWFSVLVCIVITYVNFMAGIIYAFVITSRNRYADQYEEYDIATALKDSNNQLLKDTLTDSTALIGTCGFVIVLGVMFYFIFSFF
jgi:uncharacterized membrane protein YqaE (UPF0057 family)